MEDTREKMFLHETLLGFKEVLTPFITVSSYECPEMEFSRKIEREIAFDFLLSTREKITHENYTLINTEVQGIIYFLRLKSSILSKILMLSKSALPNIISGNKKISPQLSIILLDCIEKELIFKNYFFKQFNQNIQIETDGEYVKKFSLVYNYKKSA